MDARELTEKYHKLNGRVADLEKQIEDLTQMVEKHELFIKDAKVDIAMLQGKRQQDIR